MSLKSSLWRRQEYIFLENNSYQLHDLKKWIIGFKNRIVDKVCLFIALNYHVHFLSGLYSFELYYVYFSIKFCTHYLSLTSILMSRHNPLSLLHHQEKQQLATPTLLLVSSHNDTFCVKQKRSRAPENIKIRTLQCFCFVTIHNPSLIAAAYIRSH